MWWRLPTAVLLALTAAGCDQFFGLETTRLRMPDAPPDAPGCSDSVFQGPFPFPFANGGSDPSLGPDGRELWFDEMDPNPPGGQPAHPQIFVATQSTPGGNYDTITRAPFDDASGQSGAGDPALTGDGLHLLFFSQRGGAPGWEVERASATDPFPAVPSPRASLGDFDEIAISYDGHTAYLGVGGGLYSMTRDKLMDDFSSLQPLGIAGHNPTISPDDLELFYDTTGQPDAIIMRRVRPTVNDAFGAEEPIANGYYAPSISPDSTKLLVTMSSTPVVMQMTRTCR